MTPLQKLAYKLQGHTDVQGLRIAIENRKGSVRKGKDADGKEWRTKMKMPYGYIVGTEGADGEPVDVFVGPDKEAPKAHVVHTRDKKTGKYDEDKVMLGLHSKREAKEAFLEHYDNPDHLGPISVVDVDRLKELVASKRRLVKISSFLSSLEKMAEPPPPEGVPADLWDRHLGGDKDAARMVQHILDKRSGMKKVALHPGFIALLRRRGLDPAAFMKMEKRLSAMQAPGSVAKTVSRPLTQQAQGEVFGAHLASGVKRFGSRASGYKTPVPNAQGGLTFKPTEPPKTDWINEGFDKWYAQGGHAKLSAMFSELEKMAFDREGVKRRAGGFWSGAKSELGPALGATAGAGLAAAAGMNPLTGAAAGYGAGSLPEVVHGVKKGGGISPLAGAAAGYGAGSIPEMVVHALRRGRHVAEPVTRMGRGRAALVAEGVPMLGAFIGAGLMSMRNRELKHRQREKRATIDWPQALGGRENQSEVIRQLQTPKGKVLRAGEQFLRRAELVRRGEDMVREALDDIPLGIHL